MIIMLMALGIVLGCTATGFGQSNKSNSEKSNDLVTRAHTEFDGQDYDNAIKDLTKAISLNPNNHEAYNLRAICWLAKSEYEKSIDDSNKAIEIIPNFGPDYLGRGSVYQTLNRIEKAIDDYQRAIDFDTTNQWIRNFAVSKINEISYDVLLNIIISRGDELNKTVAIRKEKGIKLNDLTKTNADEAAICLSYNDVMPALLREKTALHRLIFAKLSTDPRVTATFASLKIVEDALATNEKVLGTIKIKYKCGQ